LSKAGAKNRPFEPKPDCTDAVLSEYFLFLRFKNGRRESGAAGRHREPDFSLPKKRKVFLGKQNHCSSVKSVLLSLQL
jgi:hypothetical protein